MASPYISTPSWWKSQALTSGKAKTSFLNLANALIPYMTSPDQINVATFLGSDPVTGAAYKDYLGIKPDVSTPLPGTGVGNTPGAYVVRPSANAVRSEALSSQRASEALTRLDSMRDAAKLTDDAMGPGYKFIKQALNLLKSLGGNPAAGQGMTRAEFENMQSAFSSMLSQAQTDKNLAPYADLAQKMINPTVSSGDLMGRRVAGSNTVYGSAAKKLFY